MCHLQALWFSMTVRVCVWFCIHFYLGTVEWYVGWILSDFVLFAVFGLSIVSVFSVTCCWLLKLSSIVLNAYWILLSEKPNLLNISFKFWIPALYLVLYINLCKQSRSLLRACHTSEMILNNLICQYGLYSTLWNSIKIPAKHLNLYNNQFIITVSC